MKNKLLFILKILVVAILVVAIAFLCVLAIKAKTEKIQNPVATFEIENYGNVKIELYPEYAPSTVSNFVKLIQSGYYNGKVIHAKDGICLYMGQTAEGTVEDVTLSKVDKSIQESSEKDVKYNLYGEFVANGFEKNTLRHEKGTLTMIRSEYSSQFPTLVEESYNSATSQVGIVLNDEDARNLNGIYAGFGKVIEGLDVVEKIYNEVQVKAKEEGDTSTMDTFETAPVIKNATVDTFGYEYEKPVTVDYFDFEQYISDLYQQYYSEQLN